MKRLVLISALLMACDTAEAPDPLVDSLPDQALLEITLPGESLDLELAPLEVIEAPLLGQRSGLRDLTRGVRTYLTTTIGHLLEHLERVTASRPFAESAERTLWKVRAPDGLREYGVALRRVDDGRVSVSGWLRPLRDREPPWRFLFAGTIQNDAANTSRGALHIDLDNDLSPRSRGKMLVLWSVVGTGSTQRRLIEVVLFDGTPDDEAVSRLTRTFRYEDGPDGGLLAFDAGELNVHLTADRQGKERVRVATRWNPAGAFRADYAAIGPEVKRDGLRVLLGGECWRAPDPSVLYEQRLAVPVDDRPPLTLFERGDASACPFPEQDVPIVAAPGAAPATPPRPSDLDTLPVD